MEPIFPIVSEDALRETPRDTQAFWKVWSDVRVDDGGTIPKRSSISFGKLKGLAKGVFVAERQEDGRFVFTMAGSEVEEVFGTGLTGQSMAAITKPELEPRVYAFCEQVIGLPVGAYVSNEVITKTGKRVATHGLTLPVANREGVVNKVICHQKFGGLGYDFEQRPEKVQADNTAIRKAFFIQL